MPTDKSGKEWQQDLTIWEIEYVRHSHVCDVHFIPTSVQTDCVNIYAKTDITAC